MFDSCIARQHIMRQINTHKVNGLNEALEINVIDEPGAGGACHHYHIDGPMRKVGTEQAPDFRVNIRFQNGPIQEAGVNGISQEAQLAVVIDRLQSFQAGPYACMSNGLALAHCVAALSRLQERTRERMARGVEGTGQK
jgi:hypothetical protein